ncbi:MAG: hypothetical protein GYA16_11140 [Spirochaetes bacterium]|nr:hypothetical protein [Spirochaetota bacterium]
MKLLLYTTLLVEKIEKNWGKFCNFDKKFAKQGVRAFENKRITQSARRIWCQENI